MSDTAFGNNNTAKLALDTHILIWYLEGTNLSTKEIDLIEKHRKAHALYISAITIWEVALLANKEKIALSVSLSEWLHKLEQLKGLTIYDLSVSVLVESCYLPSYLHKDPADRFIIATAREIGGAILTHDQKILEYANNGYIKLCL